jgi:hypothetical protein
MNYGKALLTVCDLKTWKNETENATISRPEVANSKHLWNVG